MPCQKEQSFRFIQTSHFYFTLVFCLSVVFAVFLFGIANAQIVDEKLVEEVILDISVDEDDFDIDGEVDAPGRFHFLKRFGRGVSEVFTFDPVKKAEKRLHYANVELLEAKKALEEGNVELSQKGIGRAERRLEKIREHVDEYEGEEGGEFLDKILDYSFSQQKLFDVIEERAVEEGNGVFLERLHEVRDGFADDVGRVLFEGEKDDEEFSRRFDRVLSQQVGSDKKDIKNLEVLKRVEEHLPEEARNGINRAKENAVRRLADNFDNGRGNFSERFDNYTENFVGDETRLFEVLDEIKRNFLKINPDLDPEIVNKFEKAKDIAARKYQDEVEGLNEVFGGEFQREFRRRSFERFRGENGDVDFDHLRFVEDFNQRVHFGDENLQQEIEEEEERMINSFVNEFPEDVDTAEKFRELSRKMRENPDAITLRLMKELEDEVRSNPKRAEFLDRLDKEVKYEFREKFEEHGESFIKFNGTSLPGDVEIFKEFRQEFFDNPQDFFGEGEFRPDQDFARFFDRAIDHQTQGIEEHIREIDDPRIFEQFQHRFNELENGPPPEFRDEFKGRRDFFEDLDRREFESFDESDLERRKLNEEFRLKFEDPNLSEEEREQVDGDFFARQKLLDDRDRERRKEFFQERLENDPFCDDACQDFERRRFELKLKAEGQEHEDQEVFRDLERELRKLEEFTREEENHREDREEFPFIFEDDDRLEFVPDDEDIFRFEEKKREEDDGFRYEERTEFRDGEFRFEERFEIDGEEFRREERGEFKDGEFRFEELFEADGDEFRREIRFDEDNNEFRRDEEFKREFDYAPPSDDFDDRRREEEFFDDRRGIDSHLDDRLFEEERFDEERLDNHLFDDNRTDFVPDEFEDDGRFNVEQFDEFSGVLPEGTSSQEKVVEFHNNFIYYQGVMMIEGALMGDVFNFLMDHILMEKIFS